LKAAPLKTDVSRSWPLLAHADAHDVVAYRQGEAITARQFLADVAHLAEQLPDAQHVLNLCEDRYRFAVGLAAAITRRQISLLPSSQHPDMVQQLREDHPDLYALVEDASELDLPQHRMTLAARGPDDAGQGVDGQGWNGPQIDGEQVIARVFTSGSTGRPTAHVKRWGSLVRNVRAEARRLEVGPGSALVGTVPAQHMYGLESTLLMAWQSGAAIVAERPFFPADISSVLAALPGRRVLVTTPFHLRTWLSDAGDPPRLDLIVSATAPLSPGLAQEAESRTGAALIEVYGCTETGQMATRRSTQTTRWSAFDGMAIDEREGRFWVSGGHVDEPTPLSDILALDAAADQAADPTRPVTFELLGRMADLVNVAGKRTSLSYLNLQLAGIPGVVDGAFFWPDRDDGERADGVTRLVAFVVAPGMAAAQVLAGLRERIEAAFLPRPIYLLEALPRNATGKLPQDVLAGLYARLVTAPSAHPDMPFAAPAAPLEP
jgi:acyl-coenzyme A synthetase/AMP-(fatty) acid ligase